MKHKCHTCGHSVNHNILHELKHHAPFTLTATLLAVVLVLIFKNIQFGPFFEVLHPAHVLVSAIATSAMFYKYKKQFWKGIVIGVVGAILIGTISDVVFPYFGGLLLGLDIQLHIPFIEETVLILGVALLGSFIGIKAKITKEPHATHVFLSVLASLFYLLKYTGEFEIIKFVVIVIIVFIAVLIPCCISDIIFPLWFVRGK